MRPHFALVARKGQQRIQCHLTRRNRAGFVQTQHIRAGERLNAVQLLHKGVSLAELDYANRQGDRNQQNQPFGNHADHGGDGRRDSRCQRKVLEEELLAEQQQPNRNQRRADDANQAVDLRHQHRFRAANLLRGTRQAGGIAFVAHINQLRGEGSF